MVWTRFDQIRPDQTRPDQTRSDQTRPDQNRTEQNRPDQTTHSGISIFHCDRIFLAKKKNRYYTIYFLPNSSVLSYNFFQIPIIIFILQKKKLTRQCYLFIPPDSQVCLSHVDNISIKIIRLYLSLCLGLLYQ